MNTTTVGHSNKKFWDQDPKARFDLDDEEKRIATIKRRHTYLEEPRAIVLDRTALDMLVFLLNRDKIQSEAIGGMIDEFIIAHGSVTFTAAKTRFVSTSDFESSFDTIRKCSLAIKNAQLCQIDTISLFNINNDHWMCSYYAITDEEKAEEARLFFKDLEALAKKVLLFRANDTDRFSLDNDDASPAGFTTDQRNAWLGGKGCVIKYVATPSSEEFFNDLDKFFACVERGVLSVPRRGYCLWGEPGTGKSLACKEYARTRNINMLEYRFDDPYESQYSLTQLINRLTTVNPAIVLFDDLDKVIEQLNESEKSSTMNSFLHALDARLDFGKGVAFVATTNIHNGFQLALRPGRLDRKIRFGKYEGDQLRTIASTMITPEAAELLMARNVGFTMAQLSLLADFIAMDYEPEEALSTIIDETKVATKTMGFK